MNNKVFHFLANYSHQLYIILSVLAISLGGIIYIYLRPSEYIFFNWIRDVGLDNWFISVRYKSFSQRLFIPEWFVYSLPNGLWAFAYALLITSIWSGSRAWLKYFWMASIPVLVLGYEVLQYAGTIPGTFCMMDVAFGMAGLTLGILVGFKQNKKNNYEKAF